MEHTGPSGPVRNNNERYTVIFVARNKPLKSATDLLVKNETLYKHIVGELEVFGFLACDAWKVGLCHITLDGQETDYPNQI